MRICIWTDISNAGDHPEREYQRLYCWAECLNRMGHTVCLSPREHDWTSVVSRFEWSTDADMGIVLASRVENSPVPHRWPITVVAQPVGRIVLTDWAWRADFVIGSPSDTLPEYMKISQPHIERLGRRYLGVHFPPFERTLDLFRKDCMLDAYLNDDLLSIRDRYGAPKRYDIGYCGNIVNEQTPGHPIRSQVFAHYVGQPHFEFRYARDASWYDRTAEYLRFLSECRLTMCVVGDRVKTHRHVEAPMMGSPAIVVRDQLDVSPSHSEQNSVLLDDWFQEDQAVSGLSDLETRLLYSDDSYRAGWSLRGQMKTLMRRVEECHR